MIKGEAALTAYFSKVKMTDDDKLKARDDKERSKVLSVTK